MLTQFALSIIFLKDFFIKSKEIIAELEINFKNEIEEHLQFQ